MINYSRLKKDYKKIGEKSVAEMRELQADLNKIAIEADKMAEIARHYPEIVKK